MPTRRGVLGAVGAGTAGVAGCLGLLEDSSCPGETVGRVSGDWPTRGRTPGHVGATDAGGFDAAPEPRWCADADGRWESVVLAGRRLFATEQVSDDSGRTYYLHARDATDGSSVWRVRLPEEPIAEPAVADGSVHLTMEGDHLALVARYGTSDGTEEWRVELPGQTDSMPAVADGTVYVVDVAGSILAFQAASGAEQWSTRVSDETNVSFGNLPAIAGSTVYVDAAIGEGPAAVDADDGSVVWQRDLPEFHDPVTDADLLVGGNDEIVYGLEPATGETRWTAESDREDTVPLVLDGDTVYGLFEGDVRALDAGDGSRRWSHSPSDAVGPVRDLVATDGTLLAAGREGIVGVDPTSGAERWTVDVVSVDTLLAAESVAFTFYGHRLRGLAVP